MTGPTWREMEAVWRERFEERAAILEFDANLPRGEAERRALAIVGPRPEPGSQGASGGGAADGAGG